MWEHVCADCECVLGREIALCEHEARKNDLTFAMWKVTVIPFLFTTCIGGEVPTENTKNNSIYMYTSVHTEHSCIVQAMKLSFCYYQPKV